ncbi:TIGR00730 family Rossman fold protein [Tenacibaculum sp. 190524A02b]|uniref:Cytokinin riboside 5'-monophosphate phosphoribohydrolase n=1 Tax=Tenacibaculum vairaonense TaxID=3137860 RepID=A0ABM9PJW9_9FLAO
MKLENIVVFCGSSKGYSSIYEQAAIELGNYFAKNNLQMVYGGGKVGLMGVVANTVLDQKGKVIGVIPNLLRKEEVIHAGVTELIVTDTMSERKVTMSKLIDGYIALPGGFGTLDELFEALTLQQLHIEQKPVGVLNINGFFDATLKQLDFMVKEGFLKPENRAFLLVDTTVEGLMEQMKNYKAPEKKDIIDKVVR